MYLFKFLVHLLLAGSAAAAAPDRVKPDNNAVAGYTKARNELLELETRQRQDYEFRHALTPNCKEAHRIVGKIRQEEIDTVWAQNGDFAGEMFALARQKIGTTKLWKIVKRMPKGALLHAHLAAMLPYDNLISIVMRTKGMTIAANQSLATAESRKAAQIWFSYNTSIVDVDIYSTGYIKEEQVLLTKAAREFPGGNRAFRKWVKSKMTIHRNDAIQHYRGVDNIWAVFEPLFGPPGTMINYEPVFRTFLQHLFQGLVDDRISWVEIRAGDARRRVIHPDGGPQDPSPDAFWDIMTEELNKFRENFRARKDGDEFYGARIIWSDLRSRNKTVITEGMKQALDRKKKFPKLFGGYDLISQEDTGRTLLDLAPELLGFQKEARDRKLSMPFFFHAGETLGDGNATDKNLFDALQLRSRRIGHGFSLYKHPLLMQRAIEQHMLVEACPISNEVLRLATDILHHPLPAMIAHGVPTAISSDDPAMLGQDIAGLSYDFYQVIQAFDNVGLAGLGALAQNSLVWSNFEDQDDEAWINGIERGAAGRGTKGRRIRHWNTQWEAYCEEILNDYSEYR
ncbi:adenosine deaminase family protein [Stachybotrys elegans]|uniref:Adenosine deaminase n=1 Tax=Stachybotrys elegans TaxID=80388 RepID=A0A8K0SIS0_9HYPO|nr:adenosine deaminase family protein [Stachybotrys elegans]